MTILFSSSIVHSFYRKYPFSFKSVSTHGMAIQGLVNVKMDNYDHFLKMTFPYNKYHANIHHLIRRISHGLRFKSFPSSWKGLQSFVPLKFTCVHVASENMLMITVLKSLRCFLYGNAKA